MTIFNSTYHFVTRWRVEGTPQEVYALLDEPADLPRWWPAVYLDVREEQTPRGQVFHLLTKGWLPYTLRWRLRIVEPITDTGYALTATGDLDGAGRWTFAQDGPEVVVTYDWRVSASKPLLRRLTWLLRPVFSANHRWAMARGEESLRLELRRLRATTAAQRRQVPPPPVPNFLWLVRRKSMGAAPP